MNKSELIAAIAEKAIPVLPIVASHIVSPFFIFPDSYDIFII